jgi:solute:Na+ symporter, SSS family
MIGPDGEVIRDQAQAAFPAAGGHVLPTGVRGIVVAGLLAALMSSLAGVFNASATLFTMDFYSKLHPNVSQHRLVWIGRVPRRHGVIGLAWIPVIQGRQRACTTICRACRPTWRRRSSWSSSWACSGSG